MAITTLSVRQFTTPPSENWPISPVTGTYLVQGSLSSLLINNTRTNLANDTIYSNQNGWFPSPSCATYGIIVQGSDIAVANTASDGRAPVYVSCWGWVAQETQGANDTEFRQLAGNILGATYATTASAKSALQAAGFYYQYPVGYQGQSPSTGPGSDS